MRIGAFWAIIVPLAAPPCDAQEKEKAPLVTDRPDFTESALSVLPGVVQVEAGYTFAEDDAGNAHSLGEVLLRIGVLPGAELRVGLGSFAWSDDPSNDASGMEDASLGVKVELAPGSARGFQPLRPSIALLVSTTLPTGADGLGEDFQLDLRAGLGIHGEDTAAFFGAGLATRF